MAKEIFDIGDTARVRVTFRDEDDDLANPTTIQFILLDPSENEELTTAPHASIINPSVGVFYFDVSIDEEGEFVARFNGLTIGGVPQAAFETIFQGRASRMTTPLPTP